MIFNLILVFLGIILFKKLPKVISIALIAVPLILCSAFTAYRVVTVQHHVSATPMAQPVVAAHHRL